MKKIQLNAAGLQLKREKIADLSAKEGGNIKGGATLMNSGCNGCQQSFANPRYDMHTNLLGYVWICDQPPIRTAAFC